MTVDKLKACINTALQCLNIEQIRNMSKPNEWDVRQPRFHLCLADFDDIYDQAEINPFIYRWGSWNLVFTHGEAINSPKFFIYRDEEVRPGTVLISFEFSL